MKTKIEYLEIINDELNTDNPNAEKISDLKYLYNRFEIDETNAKQIDELISKISTKARNLLNDHVTGENEYDLVYTKSIRECISIIGEITSNFKYHLSNRHLWV